MSSPKFIVFEGIGGSGKTTVQRAIGAWLQTLRIGQVPYYTCEPGGTEIGRAIRRLLLGNHEPIEPLAELLLFQADRAQHAARIASELALGRWVLCDRFTASTVAYQGYGRGLDLDLITQLNSIATLTTPSLAAPDLTIWLDIPCDLAQLRIANRRAEQGGSGEFDRFDAAELAFQLRVSGGYAVQYRAAMLARPPWVRIDATQPVAAVIEAAQAVIANALFTPQPIAPQPCSPCRGPSPAEP